MQPRNFKFTFFILLGLHFPILNGCNHVFYQPDSTIYATPDDVSLSYEEITIPSRDGVTLKAWKIPATSPTTPRTALIQFHGNAENRSSHFLSVAWLARFGVDVITFDYRGYDGSSGEPSRSGLIDDGIAMLQWFEKEYPKARRYILGQSLGGAVAVTSLAKSETTADGLILESTFGSYRSVARAVLAKFFILWPFQWLPWIVLSDDENPIDYIEKLDLPMLAFHDRNDPVVPFEEGLKLYEKAPAQRLTLRALEGSYHISACTEKRKPECQRILEFLKIPTAL